MSLLEHKEAKVLLEDAEVSPGTVQGCRRRLTRFLGRYLPLFYREEQRGNAQLVIQGRLSHLERKTCEPIARQAGVQRKPVQQFVGAGKWDDEAVMSELRLDVAEAFHDPAATLVLDGSGFPKKGTESCGVQRQWCGRLGKVDNCQVGVFLACVSQGRVGPLGRRLYLPQQWAESSARRRKCHVPRGCSRARSAENGQFSGLRRAKFTGVRRPYGQNSVKLRKLRWFWDRKCPEKPATSATAPQPGRLDRRESQSPSSASP